MVREWGENGHVREVASLKEGEWSLQRWSVNGESRSCYRSGHFNEGRMVILHKSKV